MFFTFHGQRINLNVAGCAALERELKDRFAARQGFALATLNLDHMVKLRASPGFAASYAAQDLVVADGWPITMLARLAGHKLERLPGSDLVVPLCHWAAQAGVPLGLYGSTPAALAAAKAVLKARVPGLEVRYLDAPSMAFDPQGMPAAQDLQRMEAAGIGLCLLALGAPKQELFAARGRDLAPSVGFASIGAGLDFLSGRQRRAPAVLRRLGLEWLWRMMCMPRRMVPRYARCAAILPAEMIKAVLRRV